MPVEPARRFGATGATVRPRRSAASLYAPLIARSGTCRARPGLRGLREPLVPEVFEALEGPRLELLTRDRIRPLISPRAADAHKGDFGRVLIVAGSRGKSGAAMLAARGAMRSGAGLVTVAAPASVMPIIAAHTPEYMTEGLDETSTGTIDASAVDRVLAIDADVIAVGPGLGRGPEVQRFVEFYIARSGTLADEVGYVQLGDEGYRLVAEHFRKRRAGSLFAQGETHVGVTIEQLLARERQ